MNENEKIEKEIKSIINTCDQLIHEERFDELVNYYTDDAILVVKQVLLLMDAKKSNLLLSKLQNTSIILLNLLREK